MENKILIINDNLSPSYNLASEEYFLTQKSKDYILLWRNSNSVILGKNQNAYAELDFDFVKNNKISVIRRLTGGGAVFHDCGNLNFSFVFDGEGLADFRKHLSPVVAFLQSLGVQAEFSGRNDILVKNKKISGCAQANLKSRTLVHGTLLFSADLSLLSGALKPNPLKLQSKGVSSVTSRVANIRDFLEKDMTVLEFRDALASFFSKNGNITDGAITADDNEKIKSLANTKYSSFEWNIGHSPSWSMEKTGRISSGLVSFALSVKDGIISDLQLFGDYFLLSDDDCIIQSLKGCVFSPDAVLSALDKAKPEKIIEGLTSSAAVDIIFFRAQ